MVHKQSSHVQPCWRCGADSMQWNAPTKDVRCTRCDAPHPLWGDAANVSRDHPRRAKRLDWAAQRSVASRREP